MKLTTLDLADLAVLSGLLLLGFSLWLQFGAPGAIGFVGAVLIVIGMVFALRSEGAK